MLVPMARVQVIGHRRHLRAVLALLQELGILELAPTGDEGASGVVEGGEAEDERDLRALATRLDALLALLPEPAATARDKAAPPPLDAVRAEVDALAPRVEAVLKALDALKAEAASLPRHLRSVERLLPLAEDGGDLAGYETVALLLESRHAAVLDLIRQELARRVGARHEVLTARLDRETTGALIVFPRDHSREVHALLGREHVALVRLPAAFEGLSFREAVARMRARIVELPGETAAAERALGELLRPVRAPWRAARNAVAARLEQLGAFSRVGTTERAFVVQGWTPARELARLEHALAERVGPEVLVHELPLTREDEASAPVLLANGRLVRPFERLVSLFSPPRPGTIDPTPAVALSFPLFFGLMVGDVVHGLLLAGIAVALLRTLGRRSALARDLGSVLLLGATCAVGFGVVFGEALGELGRRLGLLRPLWNREEAAVPLLLAALAIGVAHVTLGLALGIGNALRLRSGRALVEKAGLLVALAGAVLVVLDAPAAGTWLVVAATVLLAALDGALGLVKAPLEVLGLAGNVVSYVRLAALGLAAASLSRVANELAASLPVGLGIAVAILLHALNLVLGAFSPAVQALRLNYVEFFGKFFEGEGRSFAPFGGR